MEKSARANSVLASRFFVSVLVAAAILALSGVEGTTDPSDVQALQVMYTSLNNPSQLSNWKPSGGDPCGESWKGVTCQGSAVVSIQISGLGLNGTMGYLLSGLMSLRILDVSDNNIGDSIPYQLPPNVTTLNLANNNLSGNLPYSISSMASLNYLNISRNSLSQSIGDIFTNHSGLATLDLSSNNFTGDLPSSFSALFNLSTLHVQNNQLNGSLNTLDGLPLTDLNVANNHFSGWIPREISSIPNFIYDGNSFDNGPAPPPPPYTLPPPGRPHNNHSQSPPGAHTPPGSGGQSSNPDDENKKGLNAGPILGISLGSLFVVLFAMLVLVFWLQNRKTKKPSAARTPAGNLPVTTDKVNTVMQEQRMKSTATVADLRPLPAEKLMADRIPVKNGSVKRVKSPITATSYTVASLQTATNSFCQENRIGEGSLGRVYRGEFPNGKIVAIKKIDNAALSLQEEDNFLEVVSNMSRLRHPNIIALIGYCAEHGQRLLVHDYIANGSLHDMLHFADERNNLLTWNARVRVALGTARALDSNMSRLRHPNIIALIGYCAEHGQRLLVHDYIANGSLHDMLHFADERNNLLTWNARVRVALGTARALEYLHEVCLPSVAHRNFKSANILLDEELNPHLSDAGLAALTPNTERQVSSTDMVGSFGYSAPEFALSGIYTVKCDVYSFGVVMLELLTGRKPLNSSRARSEQSLVRWATPQLHDIDALAKMVDPSLNGMYPAKSLSRFADIIALCIQPEPEFRPPMSEVVQALVRLMQRASVVKRYSNEESGFVYRTPDHEGPDMSY
ncbi:Protein STRUBBELIG-RECEPTOR FAMILY 8 like [Actinidia chinensis var. chinensis]|uniref:Protein STRUBBELIG-RECEPTOR FAMILY 8 like n=1 Tax=Actinidia chinensis var. chinensis TaxID=1590841 RepID=A0A2R6PX95_ACTCC|nr:Protein STRUBBELIG-RECEPTOR FAMILY 8 like [Actinidia chinensis var. chinensis]